MGAVEARAERTHSECRVVGRLVNDRVEHEAPYARRLEEIDRFGEIGERRCNVCIAGISRERFAADIRLSAGLRRSIDSHRTLDGTIVRLRPVFAHRKIEILHERLHVKVSVTVRFARYEESKFVCALGERCKKLRLE